MIDFRRNDKDGVNAKVAHIEYDPNRTANIALLHFPTATSVTSLRRRDFLPGATSWNRAPTPTSSRATTCRCATSPAGTLVHAVELRPGGGAKPGPLGRLQHPVARQEGTYAALRMPSGEIRRVDVRCRAHGRRSG